jgi:hypothetical protein
VRRGAETCNISVAVPRLMTLADTGFQAFPPGYFGPPLRGVASHTNEFVHGNFANVALRRRRQREL